MFTQMYKLTTYLLKSGWKAYDVILIMPQPKNYCSIIIRPFGNL